MHKMSVFISENWPIYLTHARKEDYEYNEHFRKVSTAIILIENFTQKLVKVKNGGNFYCSIWKPKFYSIWTSVTDFRRTHLADNSYNHGCRNDCSWPHLSSVKVSIRNRLLWPCICQDYEQRKNNSNFLTNMFLGSKWKNGLRANL